MSGSTTTTAPTSTRGRGPVVVSVVAQLTFLLALASSGVIAWVKNDYTLLIAMAGVAATNATTIVNYWVGSSDGSAKKTDLLAPSAPTVTTTTGATGSTGPASPAPISPTPGPTP